MSLERCNAVVIRRVYYQNSSLIVTFYTLENGLVDTIAKGCRSEKSPLFGALDYLNSGELIFYAKKSGALHIVSQFSPENDRQPIKTDILKFSVASVICDMVYIGCASDNPAPEIYQLLQDIFDFLEKKQDFVKILAFFALNYVKLLGLKPLLDSCAGCGCEISRQDNYISFVKGGILCDNCRREGDCKEISLPVINAVRFLSRSGLEQSERLSMNSRQKQECVSFIISLVQEFLGRRIKSAAVLFDLLREGCDTPYIKRGE